MRRRVVIAVAALIVAAACQEKRSDRGAEDDTPADEPEAAALDVEITSVDAAAAPRGDEPIIAGERLRLGLRLGGGEPPYRIAIESPAVHGAEVDVPAAGESSELAIAATTRAAASSGTFAVTVVARDAGGRTARARSAPRRIIGAGAALAAEPGEPPYVVIEDAGGRRRAELVRGETVRVRAVAREAIAGDATARILAPDGTVLLTAPLDVDGREANARITVPRLAPLGDYAVRADLGGASATATLRVGGRAFPAATRLVVDALAVRGGADRREPRAGRLRRGETVAVEARVGGATGSVSGILRLRDALGAIVEETALGDATPIARGPTARVFVGGPWTVSATLPPGRYRLEVEVSQGDDVSARYREVLVE